MSAALLTSAFLYCCLYRCLQYNLLDGPGGKQWRVYCRDIM